MHANHDMLLVNKTVRRPDEVGRGRNAAVDPAGEIELRFVTRAEEPAFPVLLEWLRSDFRNVLRHAAKVRTVHVEYQVLGPDRTMDIVCVRRLLLGVLGIRISQLD